MITCNEQFLIPELMDVVRLFGEEEEMNVTAMYRGGSFCCEVQVGDFSFSYTKKYEGAREKGELVFKSLFKRYSKLALYLALKERYRKRLPWGALTGIRPTRLAYKELEEGRDFLPLFREMDVDEENIRLVKEVIEGQKGIYERRAGNADLFVSLPFCPTRCIYCSFVTAPIAATRKYLPGYLSALEEEIENLPAIPNLRSVYIGGGTPFALETEELRRVLAAIAPLRKNGCEYTVEAGRPDVFTEEKLDLLKEFGVTRICINAQSFSDATLDRIGRKHTAEQVKEAFRMAKPYGFSVNCDLIAGLTGESVEEFKGSIDEAISLSPENITVHTLCLKKGSKLKEEVSSLQEEGLAEMISYSRKQLAAAGYFPYYLYRQKYMAGAHENVGWAKKGFASVYNIDIMEEIADILAVGANAVSKKVFFEGGRIERTGSPKDIPTYLGKAGELIQEKRSLFGG